MATQGERQRFNTPMDIAAERAVAAAVLVDAAAFDEVHDLLDSEDFADPLCRFVVAAAQVCEAEGRAVDSITVADEMRRRKVLQKVGGPDAIQDLIEEAAHVADHVTTHARIVAEKARLRETIHAGRAMAAAACQADAVWDDVRETAEKAVFHLGRDRGESTMVPLAKTIPGVIEQIAKGRSDLLLGHSTGYPELDRLTAGLQPGQLLIVAARPGMGKSAFALQLAKQIAQDSELVVPFLSYEMSHDELTTRLLAAEVGYDLLKLRTGDIPAGMDRDLAAAGETLASVPLMIDDNPPSTIAGVRSQMRRLARRHKLGAIIVDYLQLMEGERRTRDANRVEEVSEISRGLKRLASELGVPIVALSQLNRGLESRPNKRPMLSDLRESGSLEQDASLVLFLYRDSVYNPMADPEAAEIIIAKQRNGPSGQAVPVRFEGAKGARFVPSNAAAHAVIHTVSAPASSGRPGANDPF